LCDRLKHTASQPVQLSARAYRGTAMQPTRRRAWITRGGSAAAQVKGSGGCSVSDRESPWATLLGMWRARAWHLAASHECPTR